MESAAASPARKSSAGARDRAPLDLYLQDVRSLPLLDRDTEKALARSIQRADLRWRRGLLDDPCVVEALFELWREHRKAGRLASTLAGGVDDKLPDAGEVDLAFERAVRRMARRKAALASDKPGSEETARRISIEVRRSLARLNLRGQVLEAAQSAVAEAPSEWAKRARVKPARARASIARALDLHEALIDLRAEMVRANVKLVIHLAKATPAGGLDFADRVQEGNLGLLRAVEKFDYRRGVRFSSYAAYWIRQAIARGAWSAVRTIRLPATFTDKMRALRRLDREKALVDPEGPTLEERRRVLGVDAAVLPAVLGEPSSLDAPIDVDGASLGDWLEDPDRTDPLDGIGVQELHDRLGELLRRVGPRERKILRRRFGLDGKEPETLEDIGKQIGLTRERVRQLERAALAELRPIAEELGLPDLLR